MTPDQKETLYVQARSQMAQGESMLKSWSGADQADSEGHFCARRVYVAVADGVPVEDAIAEQDKRWRAYAAAQEAKVNAAPKIKRGPSSGMSTISHRWVDPERFATMAVHIRWMVNKILSSG